jgi:hypothetical protein
MAFEENGERIDDLKLIGSKVRACWWRLCVRQLVCTALARAVAASLLSGATITHGAKQKIAHSAAGQQGVQRSDRVTLLACCFAVLQRPCWFACHDACLLPSLLLLQVAEIATLFDDDGILVRFMNSNTEGNSVRCVLGMCYHQSRIQLVVLVLWVGCASQALLRSFDRITLLDTDLLPACLTGCLTAATCCTAAAAAGLLLT